MVFCVSGEIRESLYCSYFQLLLKVIDLKPLLPVCLWKTFVLRILVLPQIVAFDFGEESINELDMVSASCTVNKGDLPVDVAWLKNGGRVYTNDGVVVTKTSQRMSVLSIESVRARHAGNYTCVATNNAGVTKHWATLRVNG